MAFLQRGMYTMLISFQDPASLSSADFFSTYLNIPAAASTLQSSLSNRFKLVEDYLTLDGIPYHRIDSQDVPPGYLEVDVLLDDNGDEFKTMMVAGQVGMRICSSGDKRLLPDGQCDTVQPIAGWWIFTKQSEGEVRE
jgi:hypothetical protein